MYKDQVLIRKWVATFVLFALPPRAGTRLEGSPAV